MTPIRVEAKLAEPVVWYGDGMHLDGLLAWCYVRQLERAGQKPPHPAHVEWPEDFKLPLAKWHAPLGGECDARLLDDDGRIWGWRASDIQWPADYIESGYSVRHMRDVDDFVRHTQATGNHNPSTGPLKPKDKTYPTRFAEAVRWYAVGAPEAVRDLLGELTHIGKLANLGLGRVREWTVEPVDEDHSIVSRGRLMRRMPASACESPEPPRRLSIRPPYWHDTRRVDGYPVHTEVDDVA